MADWIKLIHTRQYIRADRIVSIDCYHGGMNIFITDRERAFNVKGDEADEVLKQLGITKDDEMFRGATQKAQVHENG